MRVLTETLATGVTVPRRSIRSGTFRFSATALSIGTVRAPYAGRGDGDWATAPSGKNGSKCGFNLAATAAPAIRTTAMPKPAVRDFMPQRAGRFRPALPLSGPAPAQYSR